MIKAKADWCHSSGAEGLPGMCEALGSVLVCHKTLNKTKLSWGLCILF